MPGQADTFFGNPLLNTGSALVMGTLVSDLVEKQGVVEQLQRQVDRAEARCEMATLRLSDVQQKNQ